jgi:hypothetical protein
MIFSATAIYVLLSDVSLWGLDEIKYRFSQANPQTIGYILSLLRENCRFRSRHISTASGTYNIISFKIAKNMPDENDGKDH